MRRDACHSLVHRQTGRSADACASGMATLTTTTITTTISRVRLVVFA